MRVVEFRHTHSTCNNYPSRCGDVREASAVCTMLMDNYSAKAGVFWEIEENMLSVIESAVLPLIGTEASCIVFLIIQLPGR